MASSIDSYLSTVSGEARQMIDALRAIVRDGVPNAVESIKWNAPSFTVDGEDRITLGLNRNGAVRLVLHRGAKQRSMVDLTAVDDAGLARWAAPDRGIVLFRDLDEIRGQKAQLTALCSKWAEVAA